MAPTIKDENNQGRKTAPAAAAAAAGAAPATTVARPQEQAVQKCPRCDSSNTKFCYYNNYSLTQPRHFCKTCRRYWTKGGALRNVPIGGGCRKNKKTKPSSSTSSSASASRLNLDPNKDILMSSAADIGGLKFFHGFTPAMDFQLGGLSSNFPRPTTPPGGGGGLYGNSATTQISSFGDLINSSSTPSMGFMNFPFPTTASAANSEVPLSIPISHHTSSLLASSIESLSSLNQDLHWKLQQQRLAILFGGDNQNHQNQTQNQREGNLDISSIPHQPHLGVNHDEDNKVQPMLFHNLETGAPKTANDHHGGGGVGVGDDDHMISSRSGNNLATEWYFDSSYAPVTPNPTPTNSSSHGNGNDHHDHQNINNWTGIQAWSNISQYGAL